MFVFGILMVANKDGAVEVSQCKYVNINNNTAELQRLSGHAEE